MKKILILILFFLSFSSYSCEIKTTPKILVISKKIEQLEKLKTTGCNQIQIQSFYNLLNNSKGRVSLSHLEKQLDLKLHSVSPFLEIVHLKDLLKSKIANTSLRHDYKIIKSPTDNSAFLLSDDEFVKVHCYNCNENSPAGLNYKISFQDITSRSHHINLKMIKTQSYVVYRAIKDIPVFRKNLSPNFFESITLETQKPLNFFEDMPSIGFLKTTRAIKKGDILLESHFTYESVVRTGEVLTIELKGDSISLLTQGKALQRGKINETIQVKSIKTSKVFSAKITKPGKAEVTL